MSILLSLLGNKYVLGGLVILGLAGFIFYRGYHTASVRYEEAQAQIQANEKLQEVLIKQRDEKVVQAEIQTVTKIKTITQQVNHDVEHIIERPVYRNVCLDADGLRDANAALTNSPILSGTPSEMPVPNPAH